MRIRSDRRTFLSAGAAAAALATIPILRKHGVSPMEFGAVGDGKTNDLSSVLAAMTYAMDRGHPVDGGDFEYGISGAISISDRARPYVQRLRLKQLNPANGRNTLSFNNCEQVHIDTLSIHVGESRSIGNMADTTGLQIRGGSSHRLKDVTLTGNGKLTFAFFWGCKESIFENIYVHDTLFEHNEIDHGTGINVLDDVTQGIRLQDCNNCVLLNPIVKNMLGNATYFTQSGFIPTDLLRSPKKAFPNLRTRGITGGGNDNVTVINPQVENVDQGIDFSGSGGNWGNKHLVILGGKTLNCGSVGLKIVGSPTACKVNGHVAENCGMMCYQIGGHNAIFKHTDSQLIGCTAINPGYNDIANDGGDLGPNYIPHVGAGFLVLSEYQGGIEGLRLVDCKAIDKQGFFLAGDDPASNGGTWPAAGATSTVLQFPWTGYTGEYEVTFDTTVYSEGPVGARSYETRTATLTAGSSTMTWIGGLTAAVGHPFVSRPAIMKYGYIAHDATGGLLAFDQVTRRPNTLTNCESIGHTIAHSKGFHRDVCHVTGGRVQELPAGVNVSIAFFEEVEDTMGMHSSSSDEERIYPKRPGHYRVEGMLAFTSSPNGYRRVQVRKNGNALQSFAYAAVAGESTTSPFNCEIEFSGAEIEGGGYIDIAGQHTATKGGAAVALNLASERWLKVEMVKPL